LALPNFVDLLTVCVEAGLDFMGALRVVVSKQKEGPLKAELERFQKQLGLGKTRSEGLRELAVRIDSPDVWTIASALMQADRLGSPIGEALRSQSEILRVRRGQKAEKAAMEASVKVLAPLVLCILPAAFIMILGPVIIQIVSSAK
jgi:tight adherence protein C